MSPNGFYRAKSTPFPKFDNNSKIKVLVQPEGLLRSALVSCADSHDKDKHAFQRRLSLTVHDGGRVVSVRPCIHRLELKF